MNDRLISVPLSCARLQISISSSFYSAVSYHHIETPMILPTLIYEGMYLDIFHMDSSGIIIL